MQETFTHGRILYTLFDPFVNQILKTPIDQPFSAVFSRPRKHAAVAASARDSG